MKSKSIKIKTVVRNIRGKGYKHFVVRGTVDGVRVSKSFSDRSQADAERQRLEILRKNDASNLRVISRLTDEQARDAETAIRLLGARKSTLADAVSFYLENYRGTENAPSLADALAQYLAERAGDAQRGAITTRQYRGIKHELNRLAADFPDHRLDLLTAPGLKTYLESSAAGLKTLNNRRGYLSTFFNYCLNRDWLTQNPVDRIPSHRLSRARGVAETLTATQAADLMAFLESSHGGRMVNHFGLSLFAGIRPDWKDGELSKFRPEFINWETGVIVLPPSATKTNEKRTIRLSPILRVWLTRYPLESFPAVPTRCRDLRLEVRKKFSLGHDVLRHTFISMLVARDRSVGDAALQAGNSETIIRKHYLDVKSTDEAASFWSILPLAGTERVVTFPG